MLNYLRDLLSAVDEAAALQGVAERTTPEELRGELIKAMGLTATSAVVVEEPAQVLAA